MPECSPCIGDAEEGQSVCGQQNAAYLLGGTHEGAMAGTVWVLVVRLAVEGAVEERAIGGLWLMEATVLIASVCSEHVLRLCSCWEVL
jgi:hypothetical protein